MSFRGSIKLLTCSVYVYNVRKFRALTPHMILRAAHSTVALTIVKCISIFGNTCKCLLGVYQQFKSSWPSLKVHVLVFIRVFFGWQMCDFFFSFWQLILSHSILATLSSHAWHSQHMNTWLKGNSFLKIYDNIHMTRMSCSNTYSAELHNHLIWLKINSKYSMQNYTYFRQMYQECLKQNI